MSDDNLPAADAGTVDDAPLSAEAGASALANLLSDPTTDHQTEDQAQANADTEEGDEPEIDVSEDVEGEDAPDDDGSQEIKGGRFAPDTAKVTLEDGTVITVAELKRNQLFQRDYTKKTTELSENRKAVDARASEVEQQAQSLQAQAAAIAEFAKKYLPQAPELPKSDPETDPMGWLRYMQQKQSYDEAMAEFGKVETARTQLSEADQRKLTEERNQRVQSEMRELASDPFFANQQKVDAFARDLKANAKTWWGVDPSVLDNLTTAAELRVLRDALLYRRALAKTTQVQKQVQDKPILPKTQGRRSDPRTQASNARQQQTERLRRTGSAADAVPILADLISKL